MGIVGLNKWRFRKCMTGGTGGARSGPPTINSLIPRSRIPVGQGITGATRLFPLVGHLPDQHVIRVIRHFRLLLLLLQKVQKVLVCNKWWRVADKSENN